MSARNKNRNRNSNLISVTTKSGFTCRVDPEKLDDWEFMKAISKTQSDNDADVLTGLMFVTNRLLGEAGEKRLVEHLRNEKGVAPTKAMMLEVQEIFLLIKAKKSQPSQS